MKRKQRINNLLLNNIKDFNIKIIDNSHLHLGHNNFNGKNETHMQIILTKKNSSKLDRLTIHKNINELLKDEFSKGLHSLEIKITQF